MTTRFRPYSCLALLSLAVACSSSGGGSEGEGGNGGGGSDGNEAGAGGSEPGQGGNGASASGGSGGAPNGGAGGLGSGGTAGQGGSGGSAGGGGAAGAMAGAGGVAPGGAAGMAVGGTMGNPSFGGALFLAVGGGKTATSADGKVWTPYPDGMTPNNLEIVGSCFGNNVVLALNHMSNDAVKQGVWSSTNGHNFVRVYPASSSQDGLPGEACAYGKGLFAVGNRYSMDDGKTWTNVTSDGGVGNRGVAFGNGTFVGAGDGNINWSSDGKAWSKGTVDGSGAVTGLSYVVFGGTKFVAVPYNNTNPSYESADGKTWKRTKSQLPTQSQSQNVGVALKKIFVVTSSGIYWLPDSSAPSEKDWTKTTTSFSEGAIGGTDSIAVSAKHWSTDGMTWSLATTPIPNNYNINRILTLN